MTYLLAVMLGAWVTCRGLVARRDAADRRRTIVSLSVVCVVCAAAALIGAKLYSVVERGAFVWHDVGWEVSSGYRYPGAMIGVLVVTPVVWRLVRPPFSIPRFLDAGVLGVCAGMVVVRIACFWTGCCHGTVANLSWATRYGVDSSPWHAHRAAGLIGPSADWSAYGHPLQLYFLAAIVAIGAFLLWFRKYQTYDGQLTLIFMVLNGISKGALESLRFSYVPSLQLYSFTMAAIGLVALGVVSLRDRRLRSRSRSRVST